MDKEQSRKLSRRLKLIEDFCRANINNIMAEYEDVDNVTIKANVDRLQFEDGTPIINVDVWAKIPEQTILS
jgi:hypothetical protein